MNKKLLIAITVVMLVLPSIVIADTYVNDCTVLNSAGETYFLNTSLTDKSTSKCFDIQADNITFDCQGYTIDGDYTTFFGINAQNRNNITVKNCIVKDWWSSARFDNVDGLVIENSTFSDARNECVGILYSNDVTVTDFKAYNCGKSGWGSAIDLFHSSGLTVDDLEAYNISGYILHTSNNTGFDLRNIYLHDSPYSVVRGVMVGESEDVFIENVYIDGVTKIGAILNSENATMKNFTAKNCEFGFDTGAESHDIYLYDIYVENTEHDAVSIGSWMNASYNIHLDGLTCNNFGTSGWGNCLHIWGGFGWTMVHDVTVKNVNADKVYAGGGHGVNIHGGYNIDVSDSTYNGTLNLGVSGQVGFKSQECDNCSFTNINGTNVNHVFWIFNSTNNIVDNAYGKDCNQCFGVRQNSQNVTVKNSKDEDGSVGLAVWSTMGKMHGIDIYNNNFGSTYHLYGGADDGNIENNYFSADAFSFALYDANNNTIRNNTLNQGGALYGMYFILSDYNEYVDNTHLGTPLLYDMYFFISSWNYGSGNTLNTSNIYYDDNSFNNSINVAPPEPDFDFKTPAGLIVHIVSDYPEETPYCTNCEVQNGHQTGVVFYKLDSCNDVNDLCEVFDYYNASESVIKYVTYEGENETIPAVVDESETYHHQTILDKIKLLTVQNDVCSNYTQLSACGVPTNWKARGKATWVFHELGNESQPLISKYADALYLTTEFDTTTNKHKVFDDDGTFSESDDVFVVDYEITESHMRFWIANINPKTIWADEIYIPNQIAWETVKYLDGAYTTHNKKKIDIQFELDTERDLIRVTPVNSKQKIPIESASGSNLLEINCMHGTCTLLSDIGVGLGGFLSAIYMPLGNLLLILGLVGGVVAIFMAIVYTIKKRISF